MVKYLVEAQDLANWNSFVASHKLGSIHQLSSWGEFQVAAGEGRDKFLVLGVFSGDELVGGVMLLRMKLPGGRCWYYGPRGPVLDLGVVDGEKVLEALLDELKVLAAKEKAVWLRVDPEIVVGESVKIDWKKLGFKKAHAHYQPENTLMLDLQPELEEILAQMKPKGRYNIKLAEKKGVLVREGKGDEDLEKFYKILAETTSRDNFSGHSLKYYREMLAKLGEDKVKLYLAEYSGEVIAGTIVTFFKDRAIYYFGASGSAHREVMGPYLLQWQAMKDARERGIKDYDFLGIAPEHSSSKHEWAGVTEFKLKFGGRRVDFLEAQEFVFNKKLFAVMKVAKKIKKLLRRN